MIESFIYNILLQPDSIPQLLDQEMIRFLSAIILILPGYLTWGVQQSRAICHQPSDVTPGNYYYDACEQRCECTESRGSYAFKCFRERENYECMSPERRQRFHRAIIDVSDPADPLYGSMRAMIDRHGVGFPIIHTDEHFLHFHRAYQYEFEEILRQKDCRITAPYWSFTDHPMDPFPYLPFTAMGMGDDNRGGVCVSNGPFASWIPADKSVCLARNFASLPPPLPTITQLNQIMALNGVDFTNFANQLQYSFHNGVHVTVGGDSVTVFSPNDPIFFLLHGNIDKRWNEWQQLSLDRINAYPYPDNLIPYTGTVTGMVRPSDVNSLERSGIRYVQVLGLDIQNGILPTCGYSQCSQGCYLRSKIEQHFLNASFDVISNIRQSRPRTLSSEQQKAWIEMMGVDRKSRQFIRKSLQQSAARTDDLCNHLTQIVDDVPLELGFDVEAFVNTIQLPPDTQPLDGVCGIVPNPLVPQPTPYAPRPTPYAPQPTPYVSRPTPYAPQPTPYVSRPTPYAPQPTPYVSRPTPYAPQPTPYAPQPTPYVSRPTPRPYWTPRPTPWTQKPSGYASPPSRFYDQTPSTYRTREPSNLAPSDPVYPLPPTNDYSNSYSIPPSPAWYSSEPPTMVRQNQPTDQSYPNPPSPRVVVRTPSMLRYPVASLRDNENVLNTVILNNKRDQSLILNRNNNRDFANLVNG
jgi:hypothetical protein